MQHLSQVETTKTPKQIVAEHFKLMHMQSEAVSTMVDSAYANEIALYHQGKVVADALAHRTPVKLTAAQFDMLYKRIRRWAKQNGLHVVTKAEFKAILVLITDEELTTVDEYYDFFMTNVAPEIKTLQS